MPSSLTLTTALACGKIDFFWKMFAPLFVGKLDLAAIDRVARARDEAAATDPDAAALGQFAVFFLPAGLLANGFERGAELAAADIEIVDGPGVGIHGIAHPDLDGIDPHLFGHHGEETLESKARMRHAVAAESAARGPVGHHANAGIFEIGDVIERRHHVAGVIGGGHAERGVGSAVKVDFAFESLDLAGAIDAQLVLHVLLVTSAAVLHHLFARIDHLDGASRLLAQDGCAKVEGRGLRLPSEPAADRGADDPNLAERQVKHMGQHVLHVMRRLRRRIKHEGSVALPGGDRGMRLHRLLIDVVADEASLPGCSPTRRNPFPCRRASVRRRY